MYDEKLNCGTAAKQAEHLSFATEIANVLDDKFNPIEQNEFLRQVISIVKDRRQAKIEKCDKELSFLKESFTQLP